MDTQKSIGKFRLQVKDKDGKKLHDTGWIKNLMVNGGKAQLALLAGDASAVPFTYLAVGTSAAANTDVTQTALTDEITDTGLERTTATVSRVTTTVANDTLQLTYTWTASGTKTVNEIGIFNASSGVTMLCRGLTGAIALANTNTLIGTYQVQLT